MYWWYTCIPALTTGSWRLDHLWLLQPRQRPTGRQPGKGVNTLKKYMGVFRNAYMGSARSNYLEIGLTYIEYDINVKDYFFFSLSWCCASLRSVTCGAQNAADCTATHGSLVG